MLFRGQGGDESFRGLEFGVRKAKVRTRMMISRPTRIKDPITATYSVLAQDVRDLNGHSTGVDAWSLHGEAPKERDRHCRRESDGHGAIC